MSIYPVHLIEWYPKGDENYVSSKIVTLCSPCLRCGKKAKNYAAAYGHHSIPWGHGDIWCSRKCYKKWKRK